MTDPKEEGPAAPGYGAACAGDPSVVTSPPAPATTPDDDPFSAIADGWAPVSPRRG